MLRATKHTMGHISYAQHLRLTEETYRNLTFNRNTNETTLTLTTTVIITAATTFVKVTSNKGKKYITIKLL